LNIPVDEAYGPINPAARQEMPRDQLPEEIPAEVGTPIQVETQDGQTMVVQISDVSEETITLDANHPLAGFDLTFEVELVAIGVEPAAEDAGSQS
jgi:peptidylprolyl isomerase